MLSSLFIHIGDAWFAGFVIGATGLLWSYVVSKGRAKNGARLYPPYAPGRLPIIGHLAEFSRPIPVQELFRQWSHSTGSVFTVQLGGKRWVILNSMSAVKSLIVERSTVYSSRSLPDTLVNDLMDGVDKGGGFAFYPYGKEWRSLRRVAHTGLVKKKIDDYQPIIEDRRTTLLRNVLEKTSGKPISLTHLIEHYTMTTILTIAFGAMCSFEAGDTKLHEAFQLTERIAALLGPGEQLREFFPILKYILPNKRATFIDARAKMVSFYGGLLEEYKKIMGTPADTQDCFFKNVLAKGDLTDLQVISFGSLFVGAGSETTASTLEWLIALLTNYPEVQDRVFQEIRENVGLDRLPDHTDETSLPYLQCVIHETLRLRPPAPLSVPHATSQDDVYQNWLIPADTTVIINLHAIHQDPEQYPEPQKFIPERHMAYVKGADTKRFSQTVEDRPHLAFSTGRRVCVGIHLAERSIYMAAAGLLSCFRFESEVPLDVDNPKDIRSPTFSPRPYEVRVVPRHAHVDKILSSL
ncbi:cytochrome P450 [Syncephalastrum racemosum]|uniref:Cytochrome P450 n=1 Tax=Syncephalastrum racemosum TaxID=13706 RepID=A0A1X2HV41_SYNRA|nr:cytochrome P450 [Syncephalastrum racemosum]